MKKPRRTLFSARVMMYGARDSFSPFTARENIRLSAASSRLIVAFPTVRLGSAPTDAQTALPCEDGVDLTCSIASGVTE